MKINQKQLRRIIREAVKSKLTESAMTESEALQLVSSSGTLFDLGHQMISELLELANVPDGEEEMAAELMSHTLNEAFVNCIMDAQGSSEDDVQLPPPHPRGSMKGAW